MDAKVVKEMNHLSKRNMIHQKTIQNIASTANLLFFIVLIVPPLVSNQNT